MIKVLRMRGKRGESETGEDFGGYEADDFIDEFLVQSMEEE